MATEINLADLKVGDEVPVDAVVRELWLPVYDVDGPPRWLRLTNVPIEALV